MLFVCYCFCAILFAQVGAVPKQNFYPFGRHHGDHSLPPNDDQSSDEFQLLDSIHFYGKAYRSVYINENGMISFDTDFNSYRTGELIDFGHPLIAIFYADVDISGPHGGHVFYRTSQDPELLKTSSDLIRNKFHWDASDYEAKSLLIVTWDRVGSYQRHNDRVNSFQLVISSNETTSYAQFLYADDEIQWIKSTDKHPHGGNQIARAVFVAAEDKIYALPESYSRRMFDINKETNVALPGVFLYRISESTIVNPQEDDEEADDYYPYDQSEYEDGEPLEYTENNEEQKLEEESDETEQAGLMCPDNFHGDSCPENCHLIQEKYCQRCHCPQDVADHTSTPSTGSRDSYGKSVDHCLYVGPHACHANAECVNYQDGFCCRCKVGFIGNGMDCLSENEAQRISGRVSGRLNDVDMVDSELHTYAVLEDGRTYTAISRIPEKIGSSMLFLNTLGSIMGWLFSKPTNQSVENGFTMTGGRLNRTVTVHVADQHTVTIQQDFSGQDNHGYLKTNVFIAGTVPHLPPSTTVDFGEHYEEFNRVEPGVVKSYSNLLVTAGNERYSVIVDQTIRFDQSCPFLHVQTGSRSLLKQDRSYVVYETAEQMVRYAAGNSLEPPGYQRENPCQEGAHDCTGPHVVCVPENQRYRCACEDGYQMQYGRENSLVCIDLDECSHGMHRCDINANCINMEGGYSCQCLPGFYGDGYQCSEQLICGMKICNTNADCLLDHATRLPRCVCRPGFVGDGVSCTLIGKEMMTVDLRLPGNLCRSHQDCSEHGHCTYNDAIEAYQCQCRPPYSGDGIHCFLEAETCEHTRNCHPDADCVFEQHETGGGYRCRCRKGFSGNGYQCQPLESVAAAEIQCNVLNTCHPNAQCVFDSNSRRYVCQCQQGFTGDGYNCQDTSRSEEKAMHPCQSADDCHVNAHCVNVPSSPDQYLCECLPGFRGDGLNICEPADECNPGAQPTGCAEQAACLYDNNEQAYKCRCLQGYAGDGKTCTLERTQDCSFDPSLCHRDAECLFEHERSMHICQCRPGFLGDGYYSCQLQSSESCVVQNLCDPQARCVPNERGTDFHCVCNAGYEGDGFTCNRITDCSRDTNICDENAVCVSENLRHVCRCKPGYHGSGFICSSDSRVRGRALVFSQGMSLVQRGLLPDDYGKQLIVVPFQIAVGVDYDCQDDKIYWTDVSGHSVHSSNLDGSNVTTLFDTDIVSPEGIVIDSLNRNLYYTDSIRDEIVVSSLRGNHRVAIIKDGLVNPRALALDPIDRKLYYSDWHREKPVIGRLNLDGTARELFVTSNIALPNGLVVLNRRRELCWADAGTQRLECIGLNGGGRHVIFAPLGYPFGLTAHNEETFYWTDWEDKRIHSVNIYGQDHHSMEAAVGASGKLYGIVAIPTQCFPGESPCMFNNGGCRYVCTPDHRGARRCLCPNDVSEVECNEVFR